MAKVRSNSKYVHIAKIYFRLVTKFVIFEDSAVEAETLAETIV